MARVAQVGASTVRQTIWPGGTVISAGVLGSNATAGSYVMSTAALPPPQLLPGQTYYLGVRNSGPHAIVPDFQCPRAVGAGADQGVQ